MINKVPWWGWLIVATVVGLVAGLAWPPPPLPKSQQDAADWNLPSVSALAPTSADDFNQAIGGLRWSGGGAETGGGPVSWRLAGFLNAPPTAALIETTEASGRGQTRHATPGDTLPDGSRLLSIEGDSIHVELGSCRSTHQLYRKNPVEQQGCGAPDEDTESRITQ